ncbi:MAG: Gfo/Idh/MocA family oxidoreductase [Syntrophobacterales bacterium]|jgi:predicted dehydrogenase|nr:Gfo/Idh/MocA family oxidoreductase [Syntrophobacterales bacterium]
MPLKIALVGAGHMGRIHLQKLSAMEDIEILGVVDVNTSWTRQVLPKNEIPCFTDYRDIVRQSDAVVIATPTESHYEVGKAALENGASVFIEKPVTSTVEQARELIDLAKKKGLVFQVGHLERFNPVFAKALPAIKKPVYVEAVRVSPFTGRSTDVTVVLDIMIHDIDLVLSIVKDRVKAVQAHGFPFLSQKLDMVNARIEFENGCVANLTASRVAVGKERRLLVFEKETQYSIDLLGGRLTIASRGGDGNMETVEYETANADAVKHELTEFIQSVRGEIKSSVTGEDGLNALMLADSIDRYIASRS